MECLSDLNIINRRDKTKIRLRTGDGQYVTVGGKTHHLLLVTRCNRKFFVWIRDTLTEDVFIAGARQVQAMEPAPMNSKVSLESTRIKVGILSFISCD